MTDWRQAVKCDSCGGPLVKGKFTVSSRPNETLCERCYDALVVKLKARAEKRAQEIRQLAEEKAVQKQREQKPVTEGPARVHKPLDKKDHVIQGSRPELVDKAERLVIKLFQKYPDRAFSLPKIREVLRPHVSDPNTRQAVWNLVKQGTLLYENHEIRFAGE